ncbi:MAG: hypothetical protein IJ217_05515 [Clostridia bacterium]|nr:hypothetical protein [Clostridia bacterium]
MSKLWAVFLSIVIFALGLSLGLYFSTSNSGENMPSQIELTKQIQDIVIREVQAEQNSKYEVEEAATEAVPRISPYAKLIVEKYYKKCEHTTVDIIDVPKELINFTEEELKEKYDKWEIREFDPKEISIYREIDANCSSHYVIKNSEGYLAVYSEITDDMLELKEKTEIEVASLREEDQLALSDGIKIYRECGAGFVS